MALATRGGGGTKSLQDAFLDVREVDKKVFFADAEDASLLLMLMALRKMSTRSVKPEWFEHTPISNLVEVETIADPVGTAITLVDASATLAGQLIRNGDETMRITSTTGIKNIVVARNVGSTGVTPIVVGDVLELISMANEDGNPFPESLTSLPVRKQNFVQEFIEAAEVTETEDAIDTYLPESPLSWHQQRMWFRLRQQIERQILTSDVSVELAPGSGGAVKRQVRIMGGLPHFINPDQFHDAHGEFSYDHFNMVLSQLAEFGEGNNRFIIMASAGVIGMIDAEFSKHIEVRQSETIFGHSIKSLKGTLGWTADLVNNRQMGRIPSLQKSAYILDMNTLGLPQLLAPQVRRDLQANDATLKKVGAIARLSFKAMGRMNARIDNLEAAA